MHARRLGRLPGTTARRLLDGGDGPSPLPQLLSAASAPGTATELRGESAARAAFRSSMHAGPLPDDLARRPTVRVTTSIMVAKAIAAVALTAGTAGSIALATTATPAAPHAGTTSESAAADGVASSSLVLTTPTPTGALTDPDGTTHPAAADEPGRSGSAGTATRTTPEAKPPHPTGLCRASSNTTTIDHPAVGDLSCADDAAAGDRESDGEAAAARPAGRPSTAPGNPEHRTGKPDDAGQTKDKSDGDDTAEEPGKAGDKAAAHADTEERGRSGEHRQDG